MRFAGIALAIVIAAGPTAAAWLFGRKARIAIGGLIVATTAVLLWAKRTDDPGSFGKWTLILGAVYVVAAYFLGEVRIEKKSAPRITDWFDLGTALAIPFYRRLGVGLLVGGAALWGASRF